MHVEAQLDGIGMSQEVVFYGDKVRLAGQIDYPSSSPPPDGFPLIFVLQHACCTGRSDYQHYADMGLRAGYAVFRWDKRGTGKSGCGGYGHPTDDAVHAYRTALSQPNVNPEQVIILAQNEGTLLLADSFREFKKIQMPMGAVLCGNMLDDKGILKVKSPVHIVQGEHDWNDWQAYGVSASTAHEAKFGFTASAYLADGADRRLKNTEKNGFHVGAEISIVQWLKSAWQTFASV